MTQQTALIIDEETLARLNIIEALRAFPNWQVLEELDRADNAVAVVERLRPDVVFLAIQMPGMNGVELARALLEHDAPPMIVFVTAYDRFAVEAFELFAVDYLLKPFDDQRFEATIGRLDNMLATPSEHRSATLRQRACVAEAPHLEKLVLRSSGLLRIVRTADILWLKSSGNYVEVKHAGGTHLQRARLSYLVTRLDPAAFCQIDRCAMVALPAVEQFQSHADGAGEVTLTDGSHLAVSATYRDRLFEQLGINEDH